LHGEKILAQKNIFVGIPVEIGRDDPEHGSKLRDVRQGAASK
jgi:hypothetical protein